MISQEIVIELNNIGAAFHRCMRLDDAENFYRNSMRLLTEKTTAGEIQRSAKGSSEHYAEWSARLERGRSALSACISSPHEQVNRAHEGSCLQKGEPCHDLPISSEALLIDFNKNEQDVIDDKEISLVILFNMALVHVHKRSLDSAIGLLDMAASLMVNSEIDARRFSTAAACVGILHNLGVLNYHLNREVVAMDNFMNAIRLGKQTLGDHVLIASTLNTVGNILVSRGAIADAMDIFGESSRIFDQHTIATATDSINRTAGLDHAARAA